MTETLQAADHRPRQAHVLRLPRRRRGRRHPEHRARRDGRQAGLLHGDGRRPPDHAGRAGRADRDERALRPRVAEQPGRRRLRRRTTPQTRRYTLPAEHAVALADPTSPAYLPGFFQLALGTVHDAASIYAGRARRRRRRAGTSTTRDVHHGCERFFRTDVQRPPADRVDPRARRRRGQARGGRHGRRRRLRPRRVDDPAGAGVPERDVRRLGLPRGVDRGRPRARRGGRGVATG